LSKCVSDLQFISELRYGSRNRSPEEDWQAGSVELTHQTRQAIDEFLRLAGRKAGQFLFAGRGDGSRALTTLQYA
jgi:hypothetical protein